MRFTYPGIFSVGVLGSQLLMWDYPQFRKPNYLRGPDFRTIDKLVFHTLDIGNKIYFIQIMLPADCGNTVKVVEL